MAVRRVIAATCIVLETLRVHPWDCVAYNVHSNIDVLMRQRLRMKLTRYSHIDSSEPVMTGLHVSHSPFYAMLDHSHSTASSYLQQHGYNRGNGS